MGILWGRPGQTHQLPALWKGSGIVTEAEGLGSGLANQSAGFSGGSPQFHRHTWRANWPLCAFPGPERSTTGDRLSNISPLRTYRQALLAPKPCVPCASSDNPVSALNMAPLLLCVFAQRGSPEDP